MATTKARKPSSAASRSSASSSSTARTAAGGVLPEAGLTRRVAWLAAAGAWVFAFVALASFSVADWPSHVVSVHNDPAANLMGRLGAAFAYWTYLVLGVGVWIPLLLAGVALAFVAMGRSVVHPVVRSIGAIIMMLAFSCLHAKWLPNVGPLTNADAGLLPQWASDQLAIRFGGAGSSMLLLFAFLLGAIVAIDEVVFAMPQVLSRTFSFLEPVWNYDWAGLVASLRSKLAPRPQPAVVGIGAGSPRPQRSGPKAQKLNKTPPASDTAEDVEEEDDELDAATAVATLDEDADEDADEEEVEELDEMAFDADDESDAGDEADETPSPAPRKAAKSKRAKPEPKAKAKDVAKDEDADDEEDADEIDEEAEDETDEAPAASKAEPPSDAAAKAPLTEDELRAKIAKLPIKMASAPKTIARDEDIPREQNFEGYRFPTLELLEDPEHNYSQSMESFVREQASKLEQALHTFDIEGEVAGIESGPVVTLYSVELAPGTRVARLETIAKDIARSLQAPNIRIIPNMVGRTAVGIEVPNPRKEKVRLKELMSGKQSEGMILPMFLGKDSSGESLVLDLTKMPHMLISGTTGSGKSVCMNSIIMSWLYTKRPDELKLVLVDPKMVEMSQFSDIPHLMCPVVTEMNKAAGILEWAVNKMEERYELFKSAGVQNIRAYNDLGEEDLFSRLQPANDLEKARLPKKLPYMVFVIDELADLIMTNKEVETSIVRIAQKARAVGIHLILATQRPQANVVTGLIKSNMPCRVSFKVASGMDSRIVLDHKGAELLLGQGDMLVLTPSSTELRRAQGTLVTDTETRKVAKFLKDVALPSFERTLVAIKGTQAQAAESREESGADVSIEKDPLFEKAVEIIIESGRGSVSLLQRRLAIGYGRASRLVDQMGLAGILGEHNGSVAREVIITLDDWKRMRELAEEHVEPNPDDVRDDPDLG